MVANDLIAVAPPGERRAVPFRDNLPSAIAAMLASVAVTIFMWAMLYKFHESLHVSATTRTVFGVIEVAIGIATLVVPLYATRALVSTLQARRLNRGGDRHDANIALADSRDRLWVVVGLGLTAFVVAFMALFLSANDGAVRHVMFDGTILGKSRTALVRGFWWNIKLFVVAEAIVLVWALIVAIARGLPGKACRPIRFIAIVYSDVFRGIPAIVTIALIVFGFSIADVPPFDSLQGDAKIYWLAVFALVLVYGAYVSEVYRAGLDSVHWSQAAAARSLGLSQWQTMRHVVVPQAVRRMLPPLMNDFVALQKDTSLVIIVGLVDVVNASVLLKSRYFNQTPALGAALCFLVITIPFTRLTDWLIKRDRERTSAH